MVDNLIATQDIYHYKYCEEQQKKKLYNPS